MAFKKVGDCSSAVYCDRQEWVAFELPFFMRFFHFIFIFLILVMASAQAQEADERAQYFDPRSSVRVQELVHQTFEPSPAPVRFGLQSGTLWFKLSRTVPAGQALWLYQPHFNAGRVRVYAMSAAPASPGAPWPGEALSAEEAQGGKLLLPGAATKQQASYYVQIQIEGFQWIQFDLLTDAERAARQQKAGLILSAQLSFVALAFIGGLFQLLHTKRAIYLGLMGVNALFLLYHLGMNGLLNEVWRQSAPGLLAFTTALSVAGLTGFSLLVQLVFPPPSAARLWARSKRMWVGAALALVALAFVLPRGPVVLAMLLLSLVVLLEVAYHHVRAWYVFQGKQKSAAFDIWMLLPYGLLFGACVLVFLGMYAPHALLLTPPELRHVDWPVMCTLLYMTLVRHHHREAARQQAALSAAGALLTAEVARRGAQHHFMALLVHEIRGPLTVIELGKRALTQRVLDTGQKAAWAKRMQDATGAIGDIVQNCDHLDRLEEGALAVAADEVAIASVLSETLDRLHQTVPDAAARISTVCVPAALSQRSCRGDLRCLGVILGNLLANALKYAPAGSAVLLHVSAVQQAGRACVEFSVHNEQGASGAPDPARVFERYYRAPSATQVAGTGLGLWLSQNLARQMHSEIRLAVVGSHIVFSFAVEQVAL